VLQHVANPVALLRELRRVRTADGVVAARDVDYRGVIWYPLLPGLAEWHEVYLRVLALVSGEPAAGRRLKAWAREAGFADVESSASLWLFEKPEEREWWGGSWADRALHSSFAEHAVAHGVTDRAGLERVGIADLERHVPDPPLRRERGGLRDHVGRGIQPHDLPGRDPLGEVDGDRAGTGPDVEDALTGLKVRHEVRGGIGDGAPFVRAQDTLVVAMRVAPGHGPTLSTRVRAVSNVTKQARMSFASPHAQQIAQRTAQQLNTP
jgi:hypothetical protein